MYFLITNISGKKDPKKCIWLFLHRRKIISQDTKFFVERVCNSLQRMCCNKIYQSLFQCFSASKWWQFAIQAKLSDIKDRNCRLTPTYLSKRCKDAVLYTSIYTAYMRKETLDINKKVNYTQTIYKGKWLNYAIFVFSNVCLGLHHLQKQGF